MLYGSEHSCFPWATASPSAQSLVAVYSFDTIMLWGAGENEARLQDLAARRSAIVSMMTKATGHCCIDQRNVHTYWCRDGVVLRGGTGASRIHYGSCWNIARFSYIHTYVSERPATICGLVDCISSEPNHDSLPASVRRKADLGYINWKQHSNPPSK